MYSNHTQKEPFRGGLHGVYGLVLTSGEMPSHTVMDLGLIHASLGLRGFPDNPGRGSNSGHVSGVSSQLPAVVGLRNVGEEYWTRGDANGNFALTGLRPGHYQVTLYDNELEVAQSSVDIRTGSLAHSVLRARTLPGQLKWQIGLPDGTPFGFCNVRLLASAHPSDRRMVPWKPDNYCVGSSLESEDSCGLRSGWARFPESRICL
jgi:rhamnogalacturonan endolyase